MGYGSSMERARLDSATWQKVLAGYRGVLKAQKIDPSTFPVEVLLKYAESGISPYEFERLLEGRGI